MASRQEEQSNRTKYASVRKKEDSPSSLVVRGRLPMQGTRVPSPLREDPACLGQLSLSTAAPEPEL